MRTPTASAKPNCLMVGVVAEDEAGEHRDHDDRGGDDDVAGVLETLHDGAPWRQLLARGPHAWS